MSNKRLWEFPVPSTNIAESGVVLIYPGGDAYLLFDYYDDTEDEAVLNSGIIFDSVQSHRHTSEKFIRSLRGSYDCLIEVVNSEWLREFQEINREVSDFWNLKHYAIFLDSNGLYEFLAGDYKIMETKAGRLDGLFKIE
ncbi:MAG TPA: hypothetical protein GXX75_04035 [Clostridiales bacterium]|nr:hypothetical protein [Clostridiales bacterium]